MSRRGDLDKLKQQLNDDLDSVRNDLQLLFDLVDAYVDQEQLNNRRRRDGDSLDADRNSDLRED